MQELIYLSQAKLRQFVPEGRRRTWIGRRLTTFRLDAPAVVGGGGVELGLAEGSVETPAGILAGALRSVEEHALWYQDPEARAGRWVYFEAPLNVVTCRDDRDVLSLSTVLFLDSLVARVDDPGRDGLRLMLHGGANHLLAPVPTLPLSARELGLSGSGLHFTLGRLLDSTLADPLALFEACLPDLEGLGMTRVRQAALAASDASPESAAWMRGYARVTLIAAPEPPSPGRHRPMPPILMATPLYVEYAHDLPD